MRSATSRAWPPSPNVQSTAMSPGCGSSRSISSPARTGTCVRVMSRRMAKALRNPDDLAIERLLRLLPGVAVPDLDVVEVADHDDLLRDARMPQERRVECHPAGRVELRVPRVAREVASERTALAADRIQVREEALGPRLERVRRPDRDAGLERLCQNDSIREGGTELGWDVEPVLGVEREVELPAKGQRALRKSCPSRGSCWGRGDGVGGAPPPRPCSRCRHSTPLSPTLQHRAPLFCPMRSPCTARFGSIPLWERVCGACARWGSVPCRWGVRLHRA